MSVNTPGELTNTLILALSQSQEQIQTIRDQGTRLERLQRDNERLRKEVQLSRQNDAERALSNEVDRLKKELHDAKQQVHEAEQERQEVEQLRIDLVEATRHQHEPPQEQSNEIDELFQKNVEAQAEIYKLKKKLRQYKEKANGRLEHSERIENSSPPRKRQKHRDNSLQELHVNMRHSRSSSNASKRSVVEKKIAAIPLLAEDGDDHVVEEQNTGRTPATRKRSMHDRLDGLLAAPVASRSPLSRTSPATAQDTSTPSPLSKRPPVISNIDHTTNEVPLPSATIARESEEIHADTTEANTAQPRPTISSRPSNRSSRRPSENTEPLRSKPLDKLSSYHFKPNPRWIDTAGRTIDDYLHGRNRQRIDMIAATLPQMPGQHERGEKLTDDELLLRFLGPNSEQKIAALTNIARNNLLAEARVKFVAEKFGRQRVDYDKEADPPGFWTMDMPGTQEDAENKKKAKELERAETKKKYDDAISGNGRWIFADE
ncbi:hypothetical protein LTR05_003347 [Lithohypha guttulata]|uniref:DNA endonuclease activator Ctp1 C-terminal domain-containing protein n=1 Tax=Lithohypha guttulata TaxID=1690604 RepID=A0AAN7T5H6_9EURO|nr:hypothetical protein LTR05_003347 [Lithohypha guttulata]